MNSVPSLSVLKTIYEAMLLCSLFRNRGNEMGTSRLFCLYFFATFLGGQCLCFFGGEVNYESCLQLFPKLIAKWQGIRGGSVCAFYYSPILRGRQHYTPKAGLHDGFPGVVISCYFRVKRKRFAALPSIAFQHALAAYILMQHLVFTF